MPGYLYLGCCLTTVAIIYAGLFLFSRWVDLRGSVSQLRSCVTIVLSMVLLIAGFVLLVLEARFANESLGLEQTSFNACESSWLD